MKPAITQVRQFLMLYAACLIVFSSCSAGKQIDKSAKETVLNSRALAAAHVGISIFDPAANKYLYNYQGDKYFVPASNTKIATCYAAMKYLGDSLVGLRVLNQANNLYIFPSGDPSFLHKDFPRQPVFEYLKQHSSSAITIIDHVWRDEPLGSGWSWNDYTSDYMAERSSLPVFGNVIEISGDWNQLKSIPAFKFPYQSDGGGVLSDIHRQQGSNKFNLIFKGEKERTFIIPFATLNGYTNNKLLADTLHHNIDVPDASLKIDEHDPGIVALYSQPTDAVLKPMMHRSDNFFAEQSLLMVSNERLGVMNDAKIIDTLLKTDFKDLPQKPRWVDGSGLSRYNLFTPQDLVFILNKMKTEFGMDRIKEIFPTGGEGTISNYYKSDSTYIYGKTGTLSGVVAFSGFIYTGKGKLLVFSTIVNNHQSSATEVRRTIEKFLQGIRRRY